MGKKVGFHVTTSVMALAALSGCASYSSDAVARDAYFDRDFSGYTPLDCFGLDTLCGAQDLALLNAPDNVVYTTRAGVADAAQNTPEAPTENLPDASAQGAIDPQNDADKSE